MNQELSKISNWLNLNKLSLNIDKSSFMIFTRKKLSMYSTVSMNGRALNRIYETTFLGVYIDSDLSWKVHVNYIKKKIAKGIGILSKARKTLNSQSLLTLYYSFIYPYLSYCIEIWGACFNTYINRLFLQQKRIVRMISNCKRFTHTSPLFKKLRILTISKLYTYRTLLFWYKFENEKLPKPMYNIFTRRCDVHYYSTRQSRNMNMPRVCTESIKHSFIYNAIKIYNKFVNIVNFNVKENIFKKCIRELLLENDQYSI